MQYEITRGVIGGAKKVLVYGPEGIGKTTFASCFPDPLFIDTEGSTRDIDAKRMPAPSSWTMLKEEAMYVAAHPELCRTLVIDTADWAERMAIQSVLDMHSKQGIEDFGYGNGYRYVYEEFGKLMNILSDVAGAGINVVVTAHATLRKFEQPDELGAYDRYTLKLIDSPKTSICALVKEWADMVLFANYKTIVITDSKTKKAKAQGGARVMYTSHHSCWDAKNRYGLAEELPFEYAAIASVIEGAGAVHEPVKNQNHINKPKEETSEKENNTPKTNENNQTQTSKQEDHKTNTEVESTEENKKSDGAAVIPEPDKRIPKALRDLMIRDEITEWDIENFTSGVGYVPDTAKIWEYEKIAPGIIDGLFIAQWTKIRDKIREQQKKNMTELPFN